MHRRHRLALAAGAVIVASSVSACGSSSSKEASPITKAVVATEAATAATGQIPTANFNGADVAFALGMIPHHEQAIEMAELALDPNVGAGTKVTAIATRIKAAQAPEIELMTNWLKGWDKPLGMDMSEGHDTSAMSGMMSADDLKALGALRGTAFDATWAKMMIAHHEGAIAMADTLLKTGSNADVRRLAEAIIAAQQIEIDEMKTF